MVYHVYMTDRGIPTPQEVAETTNRRLARYDLVNWQQGVRGGRFVAEGLGVRVGEDGRTRAEAINYSPELGLQVAELPIRKIGRETTDGHTVYQKPQAPESAELESGVIR